MSRDPRSSMLVVHSITVFGRFVMRLTLRGLRGFREGADEPSRGECRNRFKGMRRGLRGSRGLSHPS